MPDNQGAATQALVWAGGCQGVDTAARSGQRQAGVGRRQGSQGWASGRVRPCWPHSTPLALEMKAVSSPAQEVYARDGEMPGLGRRTNGRPRCLWGAGWSGEFSEGLGHNGNSRIVPANWSKCAPGPRVGVVQEDRPQTRDSSTPSCITARWSLVTSDACLPSSGPFHLEAALQASSIKAHGPGTSGWAPLGWAPCRHEISFASPLPSCVHRESVWRNEITVFN